MQVEVCPSLESDEPESECDAGGDYGVQLTAAAQQDTTTASLMRVQRDEFAMLPQTLQEAAALTTLGEKPLIVLTAEKEAENGWMPLQDKLAALSTNSVHRYLPDIKHADVIHSQLGGAASSQAILDVVASVRSGAPLTT